MYIASHIHFSYSPKGKAKSDMYGFYYYTIHLSSFIIEKLLASQAKTLNQHITAVPHMAC